MRIGVRRALRELPKQRRTADGFQTLAYEAQPRVSWHWMNGNITKSGIDKDLGWFKRVGVGGFMNFDGAGFVPRLVEKPLIYITPEWKDAFRFAMERRNKLGLETVR
jgi:hypothetical protein